MKRLCVRLDEKTTNKIQDRANEKALSLSEYIRRLVELGLRIEEMSEKKSDADDQSNEAFSDLGSSKILWEKELAWTLEMRFILRLLVDKLVFGKTEFDHNLMQESKIRAEHFVAGLLNKPIIEN